MKEEIWNELYLYLIRIEIGVFKNFKECACSPCNGNHFSSKMIPHDMKNANIWSPGHNFNSLVIMNYWTSHDLVSIVHPRLYELLRASILSKKFGHVKSIEK